MNLLKQNIFQKIIPKGNFSRNVMVLVSSTAFGQGLAVLVAPVLTRLYKPEDFGILAVFSSISSILLVVASLRYELTIPLPEKDEDAANLLVLSLSIVFIFSGITILVVYLLGNEIISWLSSPALRSYLWLLPLSVMGAGIYQALNYWAIRKKAYKNIAKTVISRNSGKALTQVVLGFSQSGPLGLVLGMIIGQTLGSGTLALLVKRKDSRIFKSISIQNLRRVARRYSRFPLISGISAIINDVGLQLQPLFLAAFYGSQVLGWFALSEQIIGMPMTLLGQAFAQVFLGEASQVAHKTPKDLEKLFIKTAKKLFLVGCVPIALLGYKGPWLFSIIFGNTWLQAGVYSQILAISFIVKFVAVPLSFTLDILERLDLQLYWDLGRLALVIGIFVTANHFKWSDWLVVLIYSISMAVCYTILLILNYMAIRTRVSKHEIVNTQSAK